MNAKVPGSTVSLLSETEAMSCMSWSLPAGPTTCGGFKGGPGTICSSCYAGQGRYAMPNVIRAQMARWTWWTTTPQVERVSTLVGAIQSACRKVPFFRVFDSGDFATVEDVRIWSEICASCPNVSFWIPTRVWWRPEYASALKALATLPNVALRRSALRVDAPIPGDRALPLSSGVTSTGPGCPKQTAGSCEAAKCRACWDKAVRHVDYHVHGQKAPIKWAVVLQRREAA